MRIAVIGAGAVGGTLAALLDRAGHKVVVTARGEHLAAIMLDGLQLAGAWGSHTARVVARETVMRSADLTIVSTKAADAAAALRESAHAIAANPVVIVQNGLAALTAARVELPRTPLVGGLALFAASFVSPGRVTVTATGSLCLGVPEARATGEHPAPGHDALTLAARILGEALPVTVADDFRGAQWSKLVVNQVNALPAITGLSAQETIAHPGLRRVLVRGIRETIAVAEAGGIRFAPLQGLNNVLLRLVGRVPLPVAGLLPRAMARRMGDVPNPGSTLQSIRRGQLTEVDALNGAVVDAAAAVGRPAPVNSAIVALVHEVERTGRFLTPRQVLARIPD
ncbi:MAG: hypothetical protein RI885_154 [Actinomycetota bacterium]|jgi:2-dehydropantoate 2-reductase